MNETRFQEITNALGADPKRLEALLALSPEQAAGKLSAEGTPVTAKELKDYAEIAKQMAEAQNGEVDESSLENVAGGATYHYHYSWHSWSHFHFPPHHFSFFMLYPRFPGCW